MAETINYRFVMRRALAATWTSLNEILKEGEWGYEKDTGKVKIGDGVTAWNDLDYFAGSPGLTIADLPPDDPAPGEEWVDAATGIRYTYYDDGDTQQWVEFGPEMPLYVLPKWAEGTSFPAGPATNDKFYRTDLNLLCFYDGARWLTMQEYEFGGGISDNINGSTVTGQALWRGAVRSDFGIYLTRWVCASRSQTNNSTNYWIIELYSQDTALAPTLLSSFTTIADTAANIIQHDKVVNSVLPSSARQILVTGTKFGAPGALIAPSAVFYRLIVT